jgi:hypothetical protein
MASRSSYDRYAVAREAIALAHHAGVDPYRFLQLLDRLLARGKGELPFPPPRHDDHNGR